MGKLEVRKNKAYIVRDLVSRLEELQNRDFATVNYGNFEITEMSISDGIVNVTALDTKNDSMRVTMSGSAENFQEFLIQCSKLIYEKVKAAKQMHTSLRDFHE